MDEAAKRGDLASVMKYHAQQNQRCTKDAMDWAAGKGHLQVVEWLHIHRTEGCTDWAMNRAAMNGHLQVVKWLHHNRLEGCTKDAMSCAAINGHLQVTKFLHPCANFMSDRVYKILSTSDNINLRSYTERICLENIHNDVTRDTQFRKKIVHIRTVIAL